MHNLIFLGGKDFRFTLFNHLPDFTVWIDKVFPDYVALNYAHTGTVKYRCGDGEEQVFTRPVMWWTEPGPRFTYGNRERSGWNHYYVCFAGKRAEEWRKSGLLPPARTRGWRLPAEPEAVKEKFERMIGWLGRERPDRALAVLQDVLLDLHEPEATTAPDLRAQALSRLAARVKAKPAVPFDEVAEARRLGLSPVHFRRLFAEQAGLPPHRFLVRARTAHAELLLRTTDLPLKVVAERCGFYDEYHFSRMYRREYQVPPATYRRRVRLLG
ncbi:helix-turn-helix domain-containing protein [Rariglobus hedericola]